ncbi:MAG: sulfide/dihydroorotate dehydrogenase-like FAD/NAD-binding protein [Candidatus Edwardsbacteria bacterium]
MYRILKREELVPNIHLLKLESSHIPLKASPGQFIIVRADEKGERIPLTLADWDADEGSLTTIFMTVGTSTQKLALLNSGDTIPTLVGPLGLPSQSENFGTVLLVGGCYGIASIFPLAQQLKKKGNRVIIIIEARSKNLIYWEERLKEVSERLVVVTRDGSYGYSGHVPDNLKKILEEEKVSRVVVNGCTFLMMITSETTRPVNIKTIVNLNPIMIDGTGMCGVCRVQVNGNTKFACVDGPEFDGHQVDWNVLLARRHTYIQEEINSLSFWECEKYG